MAAPRDRKVMVRLPAVVLFARFGLAELFPAEMLARVLRARVVGAADCLRFCAYALCGFARPSESAPPEALWNCDMRASARARA